MKFNINRFLALLRREMMVNFLPALKLSAIISLIIFVIFSITVFANERDEDFSVLVNFGIFLFIAGLIYASFSFNEFRKMPTRAEYLSLPGSHLEKIVSKWIFTNPAYILAISLLFLFLHWLFNPLWIYWGDRTTLEIFTSNTYWKLVGVFFIVHSIFMLGSIAFNKNALLKTFISLVAVAAVVIVLNLTFFRIIWSEYFDSLFHFAPIEGTFKFGKNYNSPDEMPQIRLLVFAFKYVLAPALWVASYFKLTEKEV